MTVGPEPNPIRMSFTLRTPCVTKGLLATFKVYVRAYGGKTDDDLYHEMEHCATVQKWVNLFDQMLENFKGCRHVVTADSAHVGEIMCDVA